MYKLVSILFIFFTNLQSSLQASMDEVDTNEFTIMQEKIGFEDTMSQKYLSIFHSFTLKAKCLTRIELSNNHLNFLPDLSYLTQLQYLNLSNNQLDDSTHFQLPNTLLSLDLDCNQLSVFPSILNCENLRFIKLQENLIEWLPQELPFPHLEKLFLTANPVAQKTNHLREVLNSEHLPQNVQFYLERWNIMRRVKSLQIIRTIEPEYFYDENNLMPITIKANSKLRINNRKYKRTHRARKLKAPTYTKDFQDIFKSSSQ